MIKFETKKYLYLCIIFLCCIILPVIINICLNSSTEIAPSYIGNAGIDILSYYEKINNGKYFDTLEFSMRSSEQLDVKGGYLFTLYSLFGITLGNLGVDTNIIYFIMKLLCSCIFLYAFYLFLKEFIPENKRNFTAIMVLFMSSILNLLPYIFELFNIPLSGIIFVPNDLFPIASGTTVPHFILTIALMLLSLIMVKKYDLNKIKYSIYNGLILFLIATIHPQIAVFIGLVEGIYLLTEIKSRSYKLKDLLPVSLWGLIPLPYLIYCLYIFNNYYSLTMWLSKNIHPYNGNVFYSFMLPTLLLLIFTFIKNRQWLKENKLLTIWIIGGLATCFVPKEYQVKLSEGFAIPCLCLISSLILDVKNTKTRNFLTKSSVIIIPILLLPVLCSNLILNNYQNDYKSIPKYYTNLYKNIDDFNFPSIFFANKKTSLFCLANTKQLFPLTVPDESKYYTEYEKLYEDGVKNKDFSFLKEIQADYYIYDRITAEKNDTIEIEKNLPYEKVVETEDYIIYDLRKEVNSYEKN